MHIDAPYFVIIFLLNDFFFGENTTCNFNFISKIYNLRKNRFHKKSCLNNNNNESCHISECSKNEKRGVTLHYKQL